jgi:receptor protein-tyrosine kinase
MSVENQGGVARSHVLSIRRREGEARDLVVQQSGVEERGSSMLELSRSVITSAQQGVVSEKEFKHLVTSQFEYAQLQRDGSGMSESLVAAFNPYSAKGRAIRYLAARIMLENASVEPLCFSVAGAHRNCGATYIAANLAVAFSEFGLRTLLIDANFARPRLQRLFGCSQAEGLATSVRRGGLPSAFVIPLPSFRSLSLLPAGQSARRTAHSLGNGVLANLLRVIRSKYDVIICDSPAMATSNEDCEIVAGICRNALSVLRKNHTRVSRARALLGSLDAVGTKTLGSVLCEF